MYTLTQNADKYPDAGYNTRLGVGYQKNGGYLPMSVMTDVYNRLYTRYHSKQIAAITGFSNGSDARRDGDIINSWISKAFANNQEIQNMQKITYNYLDDATQQSKEEHPIIWDVADRAGRLAKKAVSKRFSDSGTSTWSNSVASGSSFLPYVLSQEKALPFVSEKEQLLDDSHTRTANTQFDDATLFGHRVPGILVDDVLEQMYTGTNGSISKGAGVEKSVYIPMDANGNPVPLVKQRINGQDIPLPYAYAQGAHTVLGGKINTGTGVTYRQSATFPSGTWPTANGYNVPWSEIHWGDHGDPLHHENPHQHIFNYDFDQNFWKRQEPSKFH